MRFKSIMYVFRQISESSENVKANHKSISKSNIFTTFIENFGMKNLYFIFFGLIIGIIGTLWFQEHQKNKEIHQQSNTIRQQIKLLNKMVTAEAYYNEVYSYNDSDKYFFDMLNFDKNVILLVDAKAQISYDLSKMKVDLDSVHKIIKLIDLPKAEEEIFPSIKYYDLQQSTLNQFTKDELNNINNKAIEQIKSHINVSDLRLKAKKQLLKNLQNIYLLSSIYGWKVEDNHYLQNLKSDLIIQ